MSGEIPSSRKKSTRNVVDILIVVAIVGLFIGSLFAPRSSALSELVGEPAPAFKLPRHGGGEGSPAAHAGKIVVLDFWATWCQPCLKQMPILREASKIIGDDMVIVSVNVDEPSAKREQGIERFLARAGVDYETLIDDGTVQRLYQVDTLPSLIVIDSRGVVRYASSGVHPIDVIVREIEVAKRGGDA